MKKKFPQLLVNIFWLMLLLDIPAIAAENSLSEAMHTISSLQPTLTQAVEVFRLGGAEEAFDAAPDVVGALDSVHLQIDGESVLIYAFAEEEAYAEALEAQPSLALLPRVGLLVMRSDSSRAQVIFEWLRLSSVFAGEEVPALSFSEEPFPVFRAFITTRSAKFDEEVYDTVSVQMLNNSGRDARNIWIHFLAFDALGQPSKASHRNDDQAAHEFRCLMPDGLRAGEFFPGLTGWALRSDHKAHYVLACVKQVEWEDGSIWTNPLYPAWLEQANKPLSASLRANLEGPL